MTGGLLQIVTSGKQDIYLTINPEITFFKKVFRRYTNFSLELIEFSPDYPPNYNSQVIFNINKGDAIHRCYLEVEIDKMVFEDDLITNEKYISRKEIVKSDNLKLQKQWYDMYQNLKNYVDIEIVLYRNLKKLLDLDNININSLKDEVIRFNYRNKNNKDQYKNKVEESVFDKIDVSGYISSINKLVTNNISLDTNTYIYKLEISNRLDQLYNNMVEYLKYYNINYIKYTDELNKKNQINFNFVDYLGHNYFSNFFLEIGGVEIQKYSNDVLHINQLHKIKQDNMDNYMEMIGHIPSLNEFNNKEKGNTKIIIPLNFWFNKDTGLSLPLVALQYSNIVIGAKINEIKNIIAFQNFEKMFDEIIILTVDNLNNKYVVNKNLIINNFKINLNSKSITYNCLFINDEFLKLKYPELSENNRTTILQNNGTLYTKNQITKILNPNLDDVTIEKFNDSAGNDTQYLINKIQWVGFMNDITNIIYVNIAPIIGSYYPYIDYNKYISKITSVNPNPKIKLIAEAVFLDDVEREKFADSKLEYVVETINEDIFNINNQNQFECELSFVKPMKELIWYIQPQIYFDKLSNFGQNINLLFDYKNYFKNDPILNQKLTFNQLDLLIDKVDMNYYTYLMSYKFLNNTLPEGLYYYSFCLYPEESQPSGTFNLRQIKGKQYKLELNANYITELNNLILTLTKKSNTKKIFLLKFIGKTYNFFTIEKGNGKLLFGY
jgi:hypothetical protein